MNGSFKAGRRKPSSSCESLVCVFGVSPFHSHALAEAARQRYAQPVPDGREPVAEAPQILHNVTPLTQVRPPMLCSDCSVVRIGIHSTSHAMFLVSADVDTTRVWPGVRHAAPADWDAGSARRHCHQDRGASHQREAAQTQNASPVRLLVCTGSAGTRLACSVLAPTKVHRFVGRFAIAANFCAAGVLCPFPSVFPSIHTPFPVRCQKH